MADNVKYLNYGDLLVELLALFNQLANEVQGYLKNLPWSTNRKKRFMSAYSDIMNRGVLGASNNTGLWVIDVGGDVLDINNLKDKDKQAYLEAAYFIQLQMSGLSSPTKKEEEKKSELPTFDNKEFLSGINKSISNIFGGMLWDTLNDWNSLDKRDSSGKRGRSERSKMLADVLEEYGKNFDPSKYSFENSPFKNAEDFKSRLSLAILALKDNDESNDLSALRQIGLRESEWFNNGTGDPSGKSLNGRELTYGELAELQNKQILESIEQQKSNQYSNYRYFGSKLNGTPLSGEKANNAINYLNNLAKKTQLNGNEMSEIVGAFKLADRNGALLNLSKEELSLMPKYSNSPTRLKKINGVDGLYWDSIGSLVVLPYKQGEIGYDFLDIAIQNSPEALAEKKLELAINRKLSEGFETEDYLRMGAMALDIAGGITAWMGPYGMAASGILGLTSLGTNMAADIADESMSGWDVAKNAGVNLGLAAVGMVPGLGLASRTGKWITNIAKWAPRLLTLLAIKDLPESYNSLLKAINSPKELTNSDWKNIAYGLSVVAGLSRGTKGIVNNRKYKPTITQNTETETFITTKSGNKIKATLKLIDTINKAGRKGGNDKANEELRKLPGAKADDEVNINFKTGVKGKVDLTNKIKLESSTKNIGLSPEVLRYSRALAIKNIRDKAKHPLLSKYLPTDYDIYLSAAKVSVPNINAIDRIKQTWNPVPNRPFKGTKLLNQSSSNTSTSTSTSTSTPTGSNAKPKSPVLSKKDSKELLSTLRGKNFSNNEFKDESRVVGSVKGFGDLYGIRNTDGTHTLQIDFGGTRVNITGTKVDIKNKTLEVLRKDVMKKIDSQVPKENRSRIKFELIKLLKENGYLKQGGIIDKQRIQQYKKFIKK